jgi:phytoene dehydrogenase-like protein
MEKYDAVVIGAGPNGLVAATSLAKQGKSVCLVEGREKLGGMAADVELSPGVTAPEMAHLVHSLHPKVAKEMGVDIKSAPVLPTVSLSADGNHVVMRGDKATNIDGSAHADAAAYKTLHNRMVSYAGVLGQLADKQPVELAGGLMSMSSMKELMGLAKMGLSLRTKGKAEMREFLRILLSNSYDLILDEMADGPLAGAMCADATRGNFLGPRSPGTVFTMMYRMAQGGEARLPNGGPGAVIAQFADAARAAGVTIRTGATVAAVTVSDQDTVTGVTLSDGTEIGARAVVSSAGPMQTMRMAGIEHFDIETARRAKNLRAKGTVAKLNLVLSKAPFVTGLSQELTAGRLVIAPSALQVERSFNPAKYGELTPNPVIEAVSPTLTHGAQAGKHVLSLNVMHVPFAPTGGWTDQLRADLIDSVLATLAPFMPELKDSIEVTQLLTPADIEAETGATGGHWHHGELGFDQLLNTRPMGGSAHYNLAIGGLYLCGASAHPGGDITGLAGRNSAARLLKDGVLS